MNIQELLEKRAKQVSDINEHLYFLKDFVNSNQVKEIVEFGVRDGNSTIAFLSSDCKSLVSVDLVRDPRLQEVCDAYKEGSCPEWSFIEADDLDIPPVSCDLLFIDSNHTYKHLKAELARHASGVRRFIALHDTTTFWDWDAFRGESGIGQAIIEFLREHKEWKTLLRFYNNNGLMVLAKYD